jgi:hypothetical protein
VDEMVGIHHHAGVIDDRTGAVGYMKYMERKIGYDFKFDFEIGYLIKSPCKKCNQRDHFPKCAEDCTMLDQIQTILSDAISLTRNV